jgi:hypothetical protein
VLEHVNGENALERIVFELKWLLAVPDDYSEVRMGVGDFPRE